MPDTALQLTPMCVYYPGDPIPVVERVWTRLAPLWVRVARALSLAVRIVSPIWFVPGDAFDRISPKTAWSVAWGIHHDLRIPALQRQMRRGE